MRYALLVGGVVTETTDDFSELMQLFKKYRKEKTEAVTMIKEDDDESDS